MTSSLYALGYTHLPLVETLRHAVSSVGRTQASAATFAGIEVKLTQHHPPDRHSVARLD